MSFKFRAPGRKGPGAAGLMAAFQAGVSEMKDSSLAEFNKVGRGPNISGANGAIGTT